MKKTLYTLAFLTLSLAFINVSTVSAFNAPAAIEIPDNVQQIFDKSCYECHNTNSKNKGVNPKSATKITLLRLNGQEWTEADNQLINIEFRNVPLKKY